MDLFVRIRLVCMDWFVLIRLEFNWFLWIGLVCMNCIRLDCILSIGSVKYLCFGH